jgi:hypothetical protein
MFPGVGVNNVTGRRELFPHLHTHHNDQRKQNWNLPSCLSTVSVDSHTGVKNQKVFMVTIHGVLGKEGSLKSIIIRDCDQHVLM